MGDPAQIVQTACISLADTFDPIIALKQKLPDIEYAFLIILVSPQLDLTDFSTRLTQHFKADHIIGARTAGEICQGGYCEGRVVVLAFPKSHFAASARLFDLNEPNRDEAIGREVLRIRQEAQAQQDGFENEFAFLLVDGLSRREETLVAHISTALGSTQLFGGSAGDGLRFQEAPVFYNGQLCESAAILIIVRTNCGFEIFREDHFATTQKRLVVTGAIPEERLVTEINAEPAAPEYARVVGIDAGQLSPFIFAAYPIVVNVGEQHHVRAIQKVEDNKHLRFFGSIDEGMVLTVADAQNITDHLEGVLTRLSARRKPDVIFACDCILRRLEAEQKQEIHKMSALLDEHRVFGFSTYGEQHNMLHVNQTLTGIAIYAPEDT